MWLSKSSVSLLRLIWRLRAYLISTTGPSLRSQTFSRHRVLQTESELGMFDLLSRGAHHRRAGCSMPGPRAKSVKLHST